jgi:nicotinamidase-related amidase
MKEKYFTEENIDQECTEMIEEVKYYSGMRIFKPDHGHIALLVVDMQNYFLDPDEHAFVPSGPVVIPNIKRIMKACREFDIPIICTRHVNTQEDAGMMGIRWHDLIREKDARSEICKDIPVQDAMVLKKPQFDAFFETELENTLREKGVKQLIITGVMTNLCVETTARSAFIKGFDVILPVDATAAYNYEFHLATFLNYAYMFSRPVKTADLIEQIQHAS